MANVNTIKTRILNKYDVLSNYSNFKPLKGEICIAEIPTTASDSGLTPPAIGIKVGDGSKTFSELPWIQAVAGDIPAELKTAAGIDAQIAALTSGRKLATASELSALATRVTSLETRTTDSTIGNEALSTRINTLSANKVDKTVAEEATTTDKLIKQSTASTLAATAKSEAVEAAATSAAGLYEKIGVAETKVNALANGQVKTNTAAISANATAIEGIQGDIGDTSTFTGDDVSTAIKNLQAAVGTGADGLATKVSTLETEMDEVQGTLTGYTSTKTVASAVADAKAAGTTAQNQIGTITNLNNKKATLVEEINAVDARVTATNSSLTTVSNQVSTLVGSDTGKSVRSVAAEEVAKITTGADESYDTLKEISDWILNDTTGAADMANDIAELQGLHAKESDGSFKTVAEEAAAAASSAITNANLSQYATDSDLSSYKTEVSETYVTKEEVESTIASAGTAVQSATFAGAAMTKSGTALSITKDAARSALGYGTMADKSASDYSTTTQMNSAITSAKTELKGSSSDASTAETIVGAKKYADEKVAALNTDLSANIKTNTDAIAAMDATIATGTGIIDTITQTNGKITASTRRQIKNADLDTDDVFVFYCGNATGYDSAMNTVTI